MAESSQCVHQRNFHSHIQMIMFPMKMLIRLLHNNEIQITRTHPRLLIRHTLKRDGITLVHSLGNINGQIYLLRLSLSIRTLLAVRSPHFALSNAPLITLLDLLDETGCDLLHAYLDTRTLTFLVGSHTFLPLDTERLSDVFHLDGIPKVQLFHRHANGDIDIGSRLLPLSSSSVSPPESKVAKDIVESTVSTALSLPLFVLLQPLLAVSIVYLLLLLIGQYLVRVGDLGKLIGGILILIFVGVKLKRFGTVCLFDFFGSCRSFEAQDFVKVLCGLDYVCEDGE
mmetsp:Transcript_7452/g.16901  ORF Transcript_7452/g.16901 Transcript_7452/m.16901 type:complete len:284 (-) Transcript_7452:234-1085(-)